MRGKLAASRNPLHSPWHSHASARPPRPANAQQRYEVHRADLPLSCPLPSMALWNSHPRVYLPIVEDGGREASARTAAPYFVLVD